MRHAESDEEARLAALGETIEKQSEMLGRMEARLDSLHDECQRTASAGQRMLLRQEGLAKSLARLEALLHGL